MMEWSKELKVGHHSIDSHHEELFQLTSMLDACIHNHSEDTLRSIITYLEHYVAEHFKEEEDLPKPKPQTSHAC